MHALADNDYTRAWASVGASLPRPKAILVISAHWYIDGVSVTAMKQPRTIHDFGGFPKELFDVQYNAPGSPELALRIQDLLSPTKVALDYDWGLDHGTWSVLRHMFPNADIPVLQLSLDRHQPSVFHYDCGRRLSSLREEGVLLIGAGNIVHNLGAIKRDSNPKPYDWAQAFITQVRQLIEHRQHAALISYEGLGDAARLSVPTPEHYLPLLYILGTQRDDDVAEIFIDGIDMASISMMSVSVGNQPGQ
jgi:4,5-DOPA dioxygenase extradiol